MLTDIFGTKFTVVVALTLKKYIFKCFSVSCTRVCLLVEGGREENSWRKVGTLCGTSLHRS